MVTVYVPMFSIENLVVVDNNSGDTHATITELDAAEQRADSSLLSAIFDSEPTIAVQAPERF